MTTDRSAEVLQRAGLAVLLYDHRNFGISGGDPRHEINPWLQARGYHDAVTFAARLPGVIPTASRCGATASARRPSTPASSYRTSAARY